MKKADIFFDILSYWHVGTGQGQGPGYDAVVARTSAGLPFLPGKAVKGLLREAVQLAESCGAFGPNRLQESKNLFGTSLDVPDRKTTEDDRVQKLEELRFLTTTGKLTIGSARIGGNNSDSATWERWAATHRDRLSLLFKGISSTKISEKTGLVEDHSLRQIEVVVPMTLRAEIAGPDDDWPSLIGQALPFVEAVGAHRTRGLGRVHVYMKEVRP